MNQLVVQYGAHELRVWERATGPATLHRIGVSDDTLFRATQDGGWVLIGFLGESLQRNLEAQQAHYEAQGFRPVSAGAAQEEAE